jgi:hypothetical protein
MTPLKPKVRSRQPPTFVCFKYLYSMAIFAIEIFLLDFPFKRRKRTCKVCLRFQRDVPMQFFTLPSPWFQRCQWHRGNRLEYNRFSRRIRSHLRNGFRPWIRALGGIVWWENRGSKISWHCPFKRTKTNEQILKCCFHWKWDQKACRQTNIYVASFLKISIMSEPEPLWLYKLFAVCIYIAVNKLDTLEIVFTIRTLLNILKYTNTY